MKKLLLISTSLLSTAVMAAMPVNHPVGSSFTLSSAPNQRALATSLNNPAAPFIMVNQADDDNFRFGVVGPIGIGVEFGDVSDLEDRLEEIEALTESLSETDVDKITSDVITQLESSNVAGIDVAELQAKIDAAKTQEQLESLVAEYTAALASNESAIKAEIEKAVDEVIKAKLDSAVSDANTILDGLSENAYLKAMVSSQVPFMPVIYKTDTKGAFTLDSSISAVIKGNLLEGDMEVVKVDDSYDIDSSASFYTQSATDFNLGFGYSQSILENSNGMLIGGAKANLHQLSLGRSLVALTDENTEIGDAISDGFDNAESSTNVGLDLGVIWVSNYYQAGVTFTNINQPEFDMSAIDSSCSTDSCTAAKSLSDAGDLKLSDTYTMEMQTTIDAAVSTRGKQVTLGVSYDVNPVADAVGDDYQWAAASLSYYGDSHFLPGLRAGFRQNMAGSELSYVSAGLTLLKRLNLDVAVALDTVEDDEGNEIPRSFYFALGYDTAF